MDVVTYIIFLLTMIVSFGIIVWVVKSVIKSCGQSDNALNIARERYRLWRDSEGRV